ncbi:outer membrane protein transport protein [Nevskia sp.]|uniref:OmpP1/FadL family transporter n=1 Tax=Nevskia sp. TaxID=1929292 RepID=UPI0025D1D998|nr:outer membrane protein transport protein [Nevskia sp.]
MTPCSLLCRRLLVASALLASATTAQAVELARVEGFGPVSRGLAGGGLAHPVGAAAMMLNPAELLSISGEREVMFQFSELQARIEVINSATGERVRNLGYGANRGPYDLPELAFAVRRGNFAFGTGLFAAGGFGIEYGRNSFLSTTTTNNVATGLPISSRIGQLRVPFAVAWRPHPQWRLGASLDYVNASVNLGSLLDAQQVGGLIASGRATGSLVPVLAGIPNLSGAHFGFIRNNYLTSALTSQGIGGRVGVTWQPTPATAVALGYEFKTLLANYSGRGTLTAIDADNNQIVLPGTGKLPRLQFPDAWLIGISQRLSSHFAVVADLRHMFWSKSFGNTVVSFRSDDGGDLRVSLPTGFRDITTLSLGAEWQFLPAWTLRAGGSHAFQQLQDSGALSATFSTTTRNHLTSTLVWRLATSHELGLGMSYGFTPAVNNPGGNVNSVPPIEVRNRQFNPVLSYGYRF